MNNVGNFCHRFNDFMQRSTEVGNLYMHLDDGLTNEFQRHAIKESIINRKSEKGNNWLEVGETGLRALEFAPIVGATKVMTNTAREMPLARVVNEARMAWTTWAEYPKVVVGGKEYAKIGERLYTRHAVDYMGFGPLNAKLPGNIEIRRIPQIAVEEAILYGTKTVSTRAGESRLEHLLGDLLVVTDQDAKVIITVGRRTK
jgi:hypothetical protein